MTRRRTMLHAVLTLGASAGLTGVGSVLGTATARAAQQFAVTTPAELTTALAAAQPGDSIVLADGTWTSLNVVIGGNANHGLPGAPITLRAETRGGVTFTGASWINLARNHWVIDGFRFRDGYLPNGDRGVIYFGLPLTGGGHAEAHHCEVTHCSIQDFNPVNPAVQYNWVRLMGTNNTVSWSHFSGKNHSLDMVAAHWRKSSPATPTRHHFHHNYFGDITFTGTNGFGALTPVMGRPADVAPEDWPEVTDGNVIEDNLFHACNGESEIVSIKSSGNVVRRNTFVECIGYISLRTGNDNEVSGNYVFAGSAVATPSYPNGIPLGESGGVRVTGERHVIVNNYIHATAGAGIHVHNGSSNNPTTGYPPVVDVTIANNTIVNPGTTALLIGAGISTTVAGGPNVPPEGLSVVDNILVGNGTSSLIQYGRWPAPTYENPTVPVDLVFAGNIAYGAPAHDVPVPAGISVTDPLLVDAGHARPVLRPASVSPAVDAGVGTGSWTSHDIEGRPASGVRDVGAHEYGTGAVSYPPLGGADVGPSYLTLG